jgi:hypothetical protein
VSAIDRETGAVRWARSYRRLFARTAWRSAGKGVRERRHGQRRGARLGNRRGGLDALLDAHRTDGVDIQPVAYRDLVFASSVPVGDRGRLCRR